MEVEKENIINYSIPYLFHIKLYKIEVFMVQYRLDIRLLSGLFWIAWDCSDHDQLISIGIYKVYFHLLN